MTMEQDLGYLRTALPFFTLPRNIGIKVVPPYADATLRFHLLNFTTEKSISIYLDTKDALGAMGEPYWEIYPNILGDAERFYLGDEKNMLLACIKSLQPNSILTTIINKFKRRINNGL